MQNLQKKIQNLLNLYSEKDLYKAADICADVIKEYPNEVFLYNFLGKVLTDQGKHNEAIIAYNKGIEVNPNYPMIYNNLGLIYKNKNNYHKAEIYYKKAISLQEKIPDPCNNLANLYFSQNRYKEAEKYYKESIKADPKYFYSHYNLGNLYKNSGKISYAKKHYAESIKLNNSFTAAHKAISTIHKYKKNDKHLKILEKLFSNPLIKRKTEVAFALGKAFEDIKDYKISFNYYKQANDLRRKEISFSIEKEKIEFEKIKRLFNKKLFKLKNKSSNFDKTAIFIVGLPRSGTSLIEQILSSHPDVFGAGELNAFPDIIEKYFSLNNNLNTLEKKKDTKLNNINAIADEYVNYLKNISNNSKKVTDKLPINFKWIGFIKLILPNSKIIHCVRSSKDNCFSIYKNYFPGEQLNFGYNLSELCSFYNLYKDLMTYWKNLFPKFIYDIEYENLLNNPKPEITNLLKKCNLTWNKKCLEFYKNKRTVKTVSDVQVRKKLYKTSINLWKHYEDELKNSFKMLLD
ncbi:sulfotransferase [Pelagibacteraceae bacterium]|nr:sulfotransferase [Pelagibacteraceae bacterium]